MAASGRRRGRATPPPESRAVKPSAVGGAASYRSANDGTPPFADQTTAAVAAQVRQHFHRGLSGDNTRAAVHGRRRRLTPFPVTRLPAGHSPARPRPTRTRRVRRRRRHRRRRRRLAHSKNILSLTHSLSRPSHACRLSAAPKRLCISYLFRTIFQTFFYFYIIKSVHYLNKFSFIFRSAARIRVCVRRRILPIRVEWWIECRNVRTVLRRSSRRRKYCRNIAAFDLVNNLQGQYTHDEFFVGWVVTSPRKSSLVSMCFFFVLSEILCLKIDSSISFLK